MARVHLTMWIKIRLFLVFLVFLGQMLGIFFLEFLNSSGSVDQFLLAGKKRMACGTDFNTDLVTHRTEFKLASAGALCLNLVVFRMDFRFHGTQPPDIFRNELIHTLQRELIILQRLRYFLKRKELSTVHRGKKLFIVRGLAHPVYKEFHGIRGVHGRKQFSQYPYPVQIVFRNQQVLLARSGLLDLSLIHI